MAQLPAPLQNKTAQAAVGAIMFLAVGVGGGRVLGFVVEPEECSQARVDLAACKARDELIRESLDEAREAIVSLQTRIQTCEAKP